MYPASPQELDMLRVFFEPPLAAPSVLDLFNTTSYPQLLPKIPMSQIVVYLLVP
jgi:hypothetical protein